VTIDIDVGTNTTVQRPNLAELETDTAFITVLREAAQELLAMHDIAPRVVRYAASMQKWLITQAIAVLDFEKQINPASPALTAKSLVDFFAPDPMFSKNTLTAQLAEMRVYGLLIEEQSRDKRSKPLRFSDYGRSMLGKWLASHLTALDQLDGGRRAAGVTADPALLAHIHRIAVRSLIFDPRWARPPASVDLFVRTESGSNILHDLICRLPQDLGDGTQSVSLGAVRASEVSRRHTLSRGHVQRVFARAKTEGLLAWSLPDNRGELSVSQDLIRDYAQWQAIKFRAIARACDEVFGSTHTDLR
jgi:hypothetical protein